MESTESTAFHVPGDELVARLRALPAISADEGPLVLVVARPVAGERVTPQKCRLTPEGGVEGDRWILRENPSIRSQVTMMRADVARVFANGQPLSLFGDNLLVEIDLSTANLPAGTRVRVGDALCEVTDKPHTGCTKFAARFGQAARDLTTHEDFADWRLRGLHVQVIEAGDVSPGDRVRVVSRA
jgi:MOSC domain-containing protein YiiM